MIRFLSEPWGDTHEGDCRLGCPAPFRIGAANRLFREGHLRVLEMELGRQLQRVVALQRENLVHHLVRRPVVIPGQRPLDSYQASVNQNLRGKFTKVRRPGGSP